MLHRNETDWFEFAMLKYALIFLSKKKVCSNLINVQVLIT